jgi:lipocalin
MEGTAKIANASAPNQLTVQFPKKMGNYTVYTSTGSYNVLATDYTSYALVYSCSQTIPYIARMDSLWVLSRTKSLSNTTLATLDAQATALGINVKKYESVQQTCSN